MTRASFWALIIVTTEWFNFLVEKNEDVIIERQNLPECELKWTLDYWERL